MASISVSPSKGKGRESARPTFEAGWWDVFPLTETPKRSLQWSLSSVMFMASPLEPRVIGRHFSSAREFSLEQPGPVAWSPESYRAPTCIMVSPDEEHMFAFFPSCDEKPGIGSLWHRGDAIDRWKPTTHWEFPRGSGVIAGQWLGEHRKWVLDSSNTPIRLPPQGPRISTAQAMLVLVTEDHFVHLKYARHLPEFRSLSTSLLHPNVAIESQTAISHRPVTDRACFDASIGHHFSDNTVFIAYRSRNLGFPRNSVESFDFNMDLNFPNPPDSPTDWEMLGEDPQIHICTVDLKLRDELVVLRSTPLPPIKNVPRHVTEMSFMSYPPGPSPEATEPDSSSGSENLFFGVSTLDLKDFNSTPVTSSFALYKFSRISAEAQESSWSYSHHKTLPVDGALVFVTPTVQNGDTSQGVAFFGVLDVAGQQPKPLVRRKETAVGSIKVLNIPDLTDNSRWETSTIWSSIYAHGLPHCGIISPNCKQIWTPSFAIQSSLQLLPQPHQGDSKYLPNSISFALAILSRRTVIDITHILARPDVPIPEVVTTLKQALEIIQSIPTPSQLPYIADLVGTALEIYKLRAQITKSEEDKADLTARWRTAQDVTSLLAYRLAFDAISEGYRYESTAIWASMRMASFTLDLVKRLMKQCVLASTLASSADAAGEDDDPFASSNGSPDEHLQQSVLLHLSHPFTMENLGILLTHIKRFRNFIEVTAPPNADMWRFARGILTDLMDYCPVNLVELESLLETTSEEVRKLDSESLNEALMGCKPTRSMAPYVRNLVRTISNHSTLIDKARLFIEPYDLLDAVGRLSVTSVKEYDVITRDLLKKERTTWLCLRCDGRYDHPNQIEPPSRSGMKTERWKTWERRWIYRCTCGGPWSQLS